MSADNAILAASPWPT